VKEAKDRIVKEEDGYYSKDTGFQPGRFDSFSEAAVRGGT
jgi:hypothetical protein